MSAQIECRCGSCNESHLFCLPGKSPTIDARREYFYRCPKTRKPALFRMETHSDYQDHPSPVCPEGSVVLSLTPLAEKQKRWSLFGWLKSWGA
jgi:hypothetical protein